MRLSPKYTVLSLLMLAAVPVSAEDGVDFTQAAALRDPVALPSPEVATYGKYADDQMSPATGAGTLSMPLYTIACGNLSIPISLSYGLRGYKADEASGWIGMGWSLNAGGSICRRVVGLPDENDDFNIQSCRTLTDIEAPEYFKNLMTGKTDSSRDIYSYSVAGHSGTFLLTKDDGVYKVIQLPKQQVDIQCIEAADGNFDFKIVASDGSVYIFDVREESDFLSQADSYNSTSADYGYTAVTTWHLSRMSSPQGEETVDFEYADAPQWTKTHDSGGISTTLSSTNGILWEGMPKNLSPRLGGSRTTYINQRVLRRIKTRTATVEFGISSLKDVPTGFDGSPVCISGMTVYSPDGAEVRTAEFTSALNHGRLFLNSVDIRSGEVSLEHRDFSYHHLGASRCGDLFGYANCYFFNDNQYRSILLQDGNINPRRLPDATFVTDGAMSGWSSSMGISVKYEYEQSTVPYRGDKTAAIGLRIRSIITTDKVSGRQRIRTFGYSDPVCSISLEEIGMEFFAALSGSLLVDLAGYENYTLTLTLSGRSRSAGHAFENANIYYGNVTETISGSGMDTPLRTVYEFDTPRCRLVRGLGANYGPTSGSSKRRVRSNGGEQWYYSNVGNLNLQLMSVPPLNTYFVENYMEKAPIVCKTVYRCDSDGKYIPEAVERYSYKMFDEQTLHTGINYEILIRQNANRMGGYDFKSKDDFCINDIMTTSARVICDSVTTVRYFDGGDSTTTVVLNHFGRISRELLSGMKPYHKSKHPILVYPMVKNAVVVDSSEIMPWPGEVLFAYGRDEGAEMIPTATTTTTGSRKIYRRTVTSHEKSINPSGAKPQMAAMLPVEEMWVVDDTDTLRREFSYSQANGIWRTQRLSVRYGANPPADEILFGGYDASGHPLSVRRRGQPETAYSWIGDMLSSHSIAGTRLEWNYSSIPLVGYTGIRTPDGAEMRYSYEGGRLAQETRADGTVLKKYEYSLYTDTHPRNEITTSVLAGEDFSAMAETTIVYDGFGDEIAGIERDAGGDGVDITTYTEYDAVGRQVRKWMPLPTSGGNLPSVDGLMSLAKSYYDDETAYASTDYLGRPGTNTMAVTQPGALMQDYPATTSLRLNDAGKSLYNCLRYSVSGDRLTCHGPYGKGELTVSVELDPEKHISLVFTDMLGHKVLERKCTGNVYSPDEIADTYFVNDAFGTPIVVLQPMAQTTGLGKPGDFSLSSSADISRYAFVYVYDGRRQLRSVRVPGCDAVETMYDADGRPVFSRDGNLRAQGKRRYMRYDRAGRVHEEGICDDVVDESLWLAAEAADTSGIANAYVLKSYYYDSYDAVPDESVMASAPADYNGSPLGLLTATRTAVFTSDSVFSGKYNLAVNFYDSDGNIMRYKLVDYGNNVYLSDMDYTRAGQLIGVSDEAHVGGRIFSGGYRSALDRFGRTAAVTAGYGEGDRVMAAAYGYNPVGLLSSISLPGLCEERTYNLRGQPAAISSPAYEEILRYEDGIQTPTVTGRTSEREFRLYGDLRRSYHYSYDGLGRLAMANSHDEQAHSWGRFALEREFDLNSNIVRLIRSGVFARGVYDMVDNISIGYDGNQLCSLRDDAETVPLESSLDIPMADCADSSFGYDANGNLTSDPSRGITHIEYSPAGRPLRISLADGSGIEYVHDADGTRLEEIVSKPEYIKTRHSYRGAFEFEDDEPVRYNVPTGYFDPDGNLYSYTKDFQGNVVAVTSADSAGSFNIHQLTAYYPDGMPYPQEALINYGVKPVLLLGRSNRYKYSAKELTTSGGANFYDFEARNLAIGLGIFDSPDRKAVDYPSLSPYSYCAADPVNFVDPTGESGEAVYDFENMKITVYSHFYMYGRDLNDYTATRIINSISDIWNTDISLFGYSVEFVLTYEIVDSYETAFEIASKNTSPKNNFACVDHTDRDEHNVSWSGKKEHEHGTNVMYFDTNEIGFYTPYAHEYGHGLGLEHEKMHKNIMTPKGEKILRGDQTYRELVIHDREVWSQHLHIALFSNWGFDPDSKYWNRPLPLE